MADLKLEVSHSPAVYSSPVSLSSFSASPLSLSSDSASSISEFASAAAISLPLSRVFPIRFRQILRASVARFFRSKSHASVVLGDAGLMLYEHWDKFGILQYPLLRTVLVFILVYEGAYILCDLLYNILYYRTYFYDIRNEGFVVRRGILWKHELTIPLFCITDIYLDQDFFARLLGLYDLHLSSPTRASGRIAHMAGIDRNSAICIRQILLEKIGRC